MPTPAAEQAPERGSDLMRRLGVALLLTMMIGGALWWWAGASGFARQAPSRGQARHDSNGSTMEKFSLLETQRNHTRWAILADAAQVDPKLAITTITGVRFTLFSATHGPVQVIARNGVVQNQSKNLRVCGAVRLEMGQSFSLVTECLQWHAATQELEADTPVVVRMGDLYAEGRGFLGSLARERFEIREQVHARWGGP